MIDERKLCYWRFGLVILTPSLCSLVYGIDLGVTSFVLEMMMLSSDDEYWWKDIRDNNFQQGLFVSSLSLGAFLGSYIVYYCTKFGSISRRCEIRISVVLYLLGTVFNVASGTVFRNYSIIIGLTSLVLGRLLFGMGVGFIMHGSPIYMSEMCPARIRGSVVAAKEAFIVSGIVVGYAIGNYYLSENSHWYRLYASTTIVTIPAALLSFFFIPRSIRWLLLHNRIDEAQESLRFLYNIKEEDDDEEEDILLPPDFLLLQQQQQKCYNKKKNKNTLTKILYDTKNRKAFVASIGLVVLQQLSGQPSIISYVTVLFSICGSDGTSSVLTAILMSCCATFTVSTVDHLGRKLLLKTGCLLMSVAVFILSICYWNYSTTNNNNFHHHHHHYEYYNDDDSTTNNNITTTTIEYEEDTNNYYDHNSSDYYYTDTQRHIIIICMFVYIASYQLSYGPLTWLIVSEVFALDCRGEATAILVQLNYILNFGMQFIVPMLRSTVGWGPTFLFFSLILLVSIGFIHKYVPETTGLTLEQIEAQLSSIENNNHSILNNDKFSIIRTDKKETIESLSSTESTPLLAHIYKTTATINSSSSSIDEVSSLEEEGRQ